MEADEPEAPHSHRHRLGIETDGDELVIRFPKLDSEAWNSFLDLLPGGGLLRILSHPPQEFVAHARGARRERLLAIRSLLDALIEETERPHAGRGRAREVRID